MESGKNFGPLILENQFETECTLEIFDFVNIPVVIWMVTRMENHCGDDYISELYGDDYIIQLPNNCAISFDLEISKA